MELKEFTLFLLDKLGSIQGKKAFQKLTYLAIAEGIPLNCSFRMHYYGPYSETVADEFESFNWGGIVSLDPNKNNIYIKGHKAKSQAYNDKIKQYETQLGQLIERFGNMSPKELEIFATAHFIWKSHVTFNLPTDRDSVIAEIKKAKYPKFSTEEIEGAYEMLRKWNLIEN